MWISKKRFEALEDQLRKMREAVQDLKYKSPEHEQFIVIEGVHNPYFGIGSCQQWIHKPVTISLPSAVRMLADHVGATFVHISGTEPRIAVEPITKPKKA